ncbi:BTAD domain-containing putative transcriptional regulator [Lentzea sp. BCCO 10_0798]|uniref:BTAD domain-containing putative transcriptional regulator n=1 Tax=Lentzea kristufekii TaxID=3095430 RepID=A0ABU4TWE9_9PSEU|nr:BTAD domain-containing putative transcriptional regulator [Lentzea sp. BCCO 10_0798]MDX8052212.1 BTAD domain-containing putative transcriptional regulator [Lentzea sp. BCCO 10_0798]
MQIGILGPFEVRADDGTLADVPGARLRALLIALALQPGRVVPKATLVDWIWGENPPADSANALQRLVSRLRKALPDPLVEGMTDGYRLAVDPDAVDAVRFERLGARARADEGSLRVQRLRDALELWRGPALQDVGLQESAAFDAAATRLEGLRLAAVEDRFAAEISLGRGAELVTELTDLVAAHPVREKLVAALMRALVAAGRNSEALHAYQRTREALADELGVDPSPELSALHVALLRGEVGRGEENRKTNLRAELTSYIGKDADVTAVRELVAGHRLTTLTGPGGSGKTRLATETARTLLGDLPDGVWLVELAAIGAESEGGGPEGQGGGKNTVAQPALAALSLRDALLGEATSAEPMERLISAIREREALLVLDNCEHVIESAAAFAHRLLGECRRLRILATSREPLGITGEALWSVGPLDLSAAVQLLRERAAAVRTDLVVDAGTLATMTRVCRALDGMPLAIELAAARLRTMPIDQLATRLDDRFRLLTGGSRTALPRHRTLRAMVDWSWELLTAAERVVLRRLSVFAGGAGLEAAERVCADEAVEEYEVLDLLTSLTEKSLLVVGDEGAPRYRMLGTIKEYAAHRLTEAGESELARQAHLAFFTELAETAAPHLLRAEQLTWLAALSAEHDNISAAMRGALAAGEAHAAMRLAAGAGWYWWLVGHKAEGLELILAATETPGEVPDDIRAWVYGLVVTFVSSGLGDERHAAEWIHRTYELYQRLQVRPPMLGLVASLERMLREPDRTPSAWEVALDSEDPWVRAIGRLHLGKMRIAVGQAGPEADQFLEEALVEFRVLGERFGISFALTELADRIATRGEFAEACDHYEEAIAVVTEIGAVDDVIRMRARQAQLYWLMGDKDASAAAMAEAERCAKGVTWPDALAMLALAKADLARWNGDADTAYEQLGVATAVWGTDARQVSIRAATHVLLGYLTDDLGEARDFLVGAYQAAAEVGYAPTIAHVLVAVADLALRRDQHEQAAQLLAASTAVRGLPDRSHLDVDRIERATRSHLGNAAFDEAARVGAETSWSDLVAVALAP